jgi:hypothetical protein
MSNLQTAHVPVNADDRRFLDEWREMLLRAEPEFQLFTPEWYLAWSETRGATRRWQGKLTAITVRDSQNVLRGILPLGRKKVGPFKVYGSAGDSQPWRPILTDIACVQEAGKAIGLGLRRLGMTAIQIGPTPSKQAAFESLVEGLNESRTPMRIAARRPLATARIPRTWEEFRTGVLGSKFARKIGYYDCRFRKSADIAIKHFHQPAPDATAALITELGIVESRSWLVKTENSHPRYMPGTGDRLWQQAIDSTLGPAEQFDCWVMRADGQPVSFLFTLTAGETRVFIANNYDEAVSDHRTGSTLYQLVVEDAIARGVTTLDFGSDEIHYKQRWGAAYTDDITTLFVGSSLPARLLMKASGLLKRKSDESTSTDTVEVDCTSNPSRLLDEAATTECTVTETVHT